MPPSRPSWPPTSLTAVAGSLGRRPIPRVYNFVNVSIWLSGCEFGDAALRARTLERRNSCYNETDLTGGGFALAFNGRNATDTRSELGGRLDRLLLLNPRRRAHTARRWRGRTIRSATHPSCHYSFQTLPGASFIVNGATPAKNSALTSAGAELRLADGVTLLGKFDGEFASHSSTYAGSGTVRYTW